MELHINMIVPTADRRPEAIEQANGAVDPAVIDIDPAGPALRVATSTSTSIDANELVALLAQAGCPVAPHQVVQLPSICCGGCSG